MLWKKIWHGFPFSQIIILNPWICKRLHAVAVRTEYWGETNYKKKLHQKFFQTPFLGCQWSLYRGKRTWSAIEYFLPYEIEPVLVRLLHILLWKNVSNFWPRVSIHGPKSLFVVFFRHLPFFGREHSRSLSICNMVFF